MPVLIVINLWLFMELLATLLDPGYRFADAAVGASWRAACRSRIGYGAVPLWRYWRIGARARHGALRRAAPQASAGRRSAR